MDSETEELYFQKIHELVQDDDKIVTIPFLANTLNISIQESQRLIDKYVSDNLKLKEELGVSRILTGTLKDGNQKAVMRVKDDELEVKLALFENVLSNVIFSVQKSKHVEFTVIALVDQLNSTNIREKALMGSIVGRNCKKRILNFKKLPTLPTPTIKGKSSFFMPKVESKSNEKPASKSGEKQSVASTSKPDVKSKSNGIANMFSKMPAKPETTTSKDSKPASKPQGGLSNFLSKNSSKTLNKGSDSKSNSDKENGLNITSSMEFNSEASIKVEDLTSFMEVDMDEGESEEQEKKVPLREKKESSKVNDKEDVKKNKQKRKSTKRQRDPSEGSSNKRRKRIVVQDSDSDDLFEKEAEDEDVIGRSDEEAERVPSPVTKKPLPPKNKRRKAVDKTYVDDEGFVVTQTEYVYETASEDEKEVEEKPKEEKKEPPKPLQKKSSASSENDNSSPQRGGKGKKGKKNAAPQNQPTLMNFFKKK